MDKAVVQVGIGVVVALIAGVAAFLVLDRLTDPEEAAIRNAMDFVSVLFGYVALFAGVAAWLVKAGKTEGGFAAMTLEQSATPAALTIAGAILLAG